MFVSVRIDGLGKVWKKTDFVNIDSFWDNLNLAGKIYNIRHAWTLKEISKTRKGVHTGDDNGRTLHKWKPMGLTYWKFLTFGSIWEKRNLTFGQSGIVRKFKRGWTWSLRVLENLTQEESGLYLGSYKSCRRTKASSEYIFFKGASIHHTDLYMSTSVNNINNINSDKC